MCLPLFKLTGEKHAQSKQFTTTSERREGFLGQIAMASGDRSMLRVRLQHHKDRREARHCAVVAVLASPVTGSISICSIERSIIYRYGFKNASIFRFFLRGKFTSSCASCFLVPLAFGSLAIPTGPHYVIPYIWIYIYIYHICILYVYIYLYLSSRSILDSNIFFLILSWPMVKRGESARFEVTLPQDSPVPGAQGPRACISWIKSQVVFQEQVMDSCFKTCTLW